MVEAMAALEAKAAGVTPLATSGAERLLDHAAVLGHFDAGWLARHCQQTNGEALRSVLLEASDCIDRERWLWRLRLDRRQERLRGLLRADRQFLDEVLAEADPLPDDYRARFLMQALCGVFTETADLQDRDLPALLDVATWLAGLGTPSPEPRAVRRELARRSRLAAFAEVSGRFVGREDAVGDLDRFIEGPPTPEIQFLPISGLGGIGKSALLARVLHRRLLREGGTVEMIVHIDFDRFGVSPSDQGQLDAELTRQLALAVPEVAPELDRIRHEIGRGRRRSTGIQVQVERSSSKESFDLAHGDLLSELFYLFQNRGMAHRPLVLVFDTVEELQSQSEFALEQMAEWLTGLHQKGGFGDLRVIVSGRAEVLLPNWMRVRVAGPLVLDELSLEPALSVLQQFSVSRRAGRLIFERYGGNPLILRLAARLVKQLGESILSDEAGGADEPLDREVVQGMLYDRVLGHVRDPRVRQLAYPGLVLRRVTPALIRQVIAPVSLEPPLAQREEEVLFNSLRLQVWLVKPGATANELEHRSDIRKLMMKLMARDPSRAADAERVHRGAVRYYETTGRGEANASAEALYHRLMVADGSLAPRLDGGVAERAMKAIGASFEELPRQHQVALRVALGQPIDDGDADLVPPYLMKAYIDRRGPELVAREEFGRALLLASSVNGGPPADWLVTTLDALGKWRDLAERMSPIRNGPAPVEGAAEWLRQQTVLASALLRSGDVASAHSVARQAAQSTVFRDSATLPIAVHCSQLEARTAGLLGLPHHGSLTFTTADLLRNDDLAFEHLRYLQVTGQVGQTAFRPTQLQFFPSAEWLDLICQVGGAPMAAALEKIVAELRTIHPQRITTGRLLGHFGPLFQDALMEPFLMRRIPPDAQRVIGAILDHPEFRPAARSAVLEVVGMDSRRNVDVFRELVSAIEAHLPLIPRDLMEMQADSPEEVRLCATSLVAFADRCQALSHLLTAVRILRPDSRTAASVAIGFDGWHTQHERSLAHQHAAALGGRTGPMFA
jgi:hypothetical protein